MAQAKCITTAIRELMSRGRPPKSPTPVHAAHSELVVALAGNVPPPIWADVGSEDLHGCAEQLEKVFLAVHIYLTPIIADTAESIAGGMPDRRYLENLFRARSADALCAIRSAAEEMREHEDWRAS